MAATTPETYLGDLNPAQQEGAGAGKACVRTLGSGQCVAAGGTTT